MNSEKEKNIKNEPLIFEVKGNSQDDGPGIRSVVFFKGCSLDCSWCHNPESKKLKKELAFDPNICTNCNACLDECPENAITNVNGILIDRDKCKLCFACTEVCPSGSMEQVGKQMSINSIMAKVLKDKPFFDNSGGGVTISGGEPALFPEFISSLLKRLKEDGIHTLIETAGLFNLDKFINLCIPYLDTIYFDIKILNNEKHKQSCGVYNEKILKNFQTLVEISKEKGIELLPRIPLIPGLTDTDENLKDITTYLKSLGIKKAAVLPYNPLWKDKIEKTGDEFPFVGKKNMERWQNTDEIQRCESIFFESDIQL